MLETGFGLGLNFLATWAAWARDPARCDTLHFLSVEAHPVTAADLLRGAQTLEAGNPSPPPPPLLDGVRAGAIALADTWRDVGPGCHTLAFAEGRVQLHPGHRQCRRGAHRLGPRSARGRRLLRRLQPHPQPDHVVRGDAGAMARHCQVGTVLASYSVHREVRGLLGRLGFQVRKRPGVSPKRHRMEAVYAPDSAPSSDTARAGP